MLQYLKVGITFKILDEKAAELSDNEAAQRMKEHRGQACIVAHQEARAFAYSQIMQLAKPDPVVLFIKLGAICTVCRAGDIVADSEKRHLNFLFARCNFDGAAVLALFSSAARMRIFGKRLSSATYRGKFT